MNHIQRQPIERNLAMELVRVTEAAAMAALRHMGQGDKNKVDGAAVDAMRHTLGGISMDGVVVIGEGEKDEAPMLYNGERIGDGSDPKVDIAAVNPWMLRMAGEVADGVHVHPLGEPGYLARHVVPNVAAGAEKSNRSPSDLAVIVPVMTIVGDTDEERHNERELARASMSFYASTPNYAFIMDEAGFDGTTARLREKQKAGDFAGMAAQVSDDHIAAFATESTWDALADSLIDKYGGTATRLVFYNAVGDPDRFERYGEVARLVSARSASA